MFQVFFLIGFVLLEERQDIRRHITQLRRSHSPESHGFSFQEAFENWALTAGRKYHGPAILGMTVMNAAFGEQTCTPSDH
jgi:hypothetical protein